MANKPIEDLTLTEQTTFRTEIGATDAANLTSGTLPDARFPATLPIASGVNLTALNATNLASGTVATARLGTGTASSTTYLAGDGSWKAPASSAPAADSITTAMLQAGAVTAAKVADGALTVAKTSGLQAALDAKQSIPTTTSVTVTRSEVTPPDMTWKRIGTGRPFQTIDEKHLHFVSSWESGNVGPFFTPNDGQSRFLNPNITVVNGEAIVVAASTVTQLISSNVGSIAPWVSVELTIKSASGNGGTGPAIIRDQDRFIAFRFDLANGQLQLQEQSNSTTVKFVNVAYTPTYPLKLTLKLCGTTITGWVGDKLISVLSGGSVVDYKNPDIWKEYHYGILAKTNTATLTKLRCGASGVLGAENILAVTRGDGSPYFIGNRLLMTADCHGVGNLEDWNTCLWLVDLDTAQIEVIGRLYFKQDFDGEKRLEGGNYCRLQYHEDVGRWLITVITFDGWNPRGAGSPQAWESYGWVDIDPYGENFITDDMIKPLGYLNTVGAGYSSSVWKDGSTWKALVSLSPTAIDEDDPNQFGAIRSRYYTGPDLDNLTLQWADTTQGHTEGGGLARFNGTDYFHFSATSNVYPVFNVAGTVIGGLRNISRYGDTISIDSGESWCEWIARPSANGKSEFFAIGNTKEIFRVLNSSGTTSVYNQNGLYDLEPLMNQNRGGMAVWKADQTSAGLEWPWYNHKGLKVKAAATWVNPTGTTLKTGLRLALPLTVNGKDSSDFSRNVLAVGTVTYSANGVVCAASSGNYNRELGVTPVTGDWTASFVIKYITTTITDGFVLNIGASTNIDIANQRPRLGINNGTAWVSATPATTTISGVTARHILARRSGNVFSLWQDGVKVAESTVTTPVTTAGYIAVGGQLSYTGYPATPTFTNPLYNAAIKNVKFWVRALSDADIASDYNGGSTWMP